MATPTAVDVLFAVPYASGMAEDRGCSTAFDPIVCTFGPPGGANPADRIYQLDVTGIPAGWFVSAVKINNLQADPPMGVDDRGGRCVGFSRRSPSVH